MNEKKPHQPDSDETRVPEEARQPETAVTAGDVEERQDAPLVDDALLQIAQRDDSVGASMSADLAALRAEMESLKERAGEASSQALVSVKTGAETTARSARDTVRHSPLAALGVAVAVGYMLGLSMTR